MNLSPQTNKPKITEFRRAYSAAYIIIGEPKLADWTQTNTDLDFGTIHLLIWTSQLGPLHFTTDISGMGPSASYLCTKYSAAIQSMYFRYKCGVKYLLLSPTDSIAAGDAGTTMQSREGEIEPLEIPPHNPAGAYRRKGKTQRLLTT